MKKIIAIDNVLAIIAGLFILLFVYTAVSKLIDLPRFEASLRKSALISPYAKALSFAVPIVEIIISVLLLIPVRRTTGLILSSFLMLGFTVYVAAVLSTAKELPCTCGGVISSMTWRQHLIFNSGFLLLGVIALLLTTYKNFLKKQKEQEQQIVFT